MAQTSQPGEPWESQDDLEQLRSLLLGAELATLADLQDRLDDRDRFSSEVAAVLPRAMRKSTEQGEELSEVMVPTVEEIVRLSIKKDLNKFATALFPVIGPAIRKSISETIRQMLQSLNQALEHGLSWQGIKWRIQSVRTGIPFAQLVMLNSLEYRVEQVFLIHRETGLLLHHVQLEDALAQDPDMVSSMLSAIGDFVTDSFQASEPQHLDSLQVGDFRILIEQSPSVALAVVIRGDAPSDIGSLLSEALEEIHQHLGEALSEFDGDVTPFAASDDAMRQCLVQSRIERKAQKLSLGTKLVWAAGLSLLALWVGSRVLLSLAQDELLDNLGRVPGLVVTESERSGSHLVIRGLRDVDAQDPAELVEASDVESADVTLDFVPFRSLDPIFIERRIIRKLAPPATVSVSVRDGWVSVDGRADHRWIERFMSVAEHHPDIVGVDAEGLQNNNRQAVFEAAAALENLSLLYEPGDVEFSGEQKAQLNRIAAVCKILVDNARIVGMTPVIRVRGSTDSSGTFRNNVKLSLARAERVRDFLMAAGVAGQHLVAEGLDVPAAEEASPEEQRQNRRVFFTVEPGAAGQVR